VTDASHLDVLAEHYGTDKAPSSHNYTPLYGRYLDYASRQKSGTLLELGWGGHEDPNKGGESARMWNEWLPGWDVVVVDNEKKNFPADLLDAVTLLDGWDQADPAIGDNYGPFDVIIDDASHLSSKTIESFELLWPHLKSGGWYVVEDTHSSYHDEYYGKTEAHRDPGMGVHSDGYRFDKEQPITAMAFLKRLADEANFANRGEQWDLYPDAYWDGYEVAEIHFHFNICFVRKR
jgi:hypothetical protein